MVCFCKNTLTSLQVALPTLNASASLSASATANISALGALAAWLAKFGLPAAPWQPNPAWLDMPLPRLTLSASAIATLQAFAQLQALALSLGLNLMVPAQATAFTRLAVTLNARLAALSATIGGPINAAAWVRLSAALTASAQVSAAARLGLFPPGLALPPMGPPLSLWRAFLSALRALLPVIAITNQLQLNATASLSEQLAPILRVMLRIPMPSMVATASLMASLTAALSAIAQIRLALGIDPLEIGQPKVQLMVSEQLSATVSLVEQSAGLSLSELLALLPTLPPPEYCPSLMAPSAVVNAALALNLPPLGWQVPALSSLPILSVGLPVASFCAQLQAALGLQASLSPCGSGCDAAKLMAAL